MIEYHCCDFSFEQYAQKIALTHPDSPALSENGEGGREAHQGAYEGINSIDPAISVNNECDWNKFYAKSQGYKDRMYISTEFNRWLMAINEEQGTLVEVGCGHGSTMFPLLQTYLYISYLATDISSSALELLQRDTRYNPTRAQLQLWDPALAPMCCSVLSPKLLGCLLIFTLSAVYPDHHKDFMLNVISSLARDSVILFRDYGLYDMTMFRHGSPVHGTKCFRRKDGTLSFYFELNYVRNLVESCGLEIIELNYATVRLKNRRTGQDLHRVFVHGVFKRK